MHMQSFHISVQGASHIKRNKECQDSSDCYHDENCDIVIVCDGHGGDDYVRSAKGSAFACAAAKENILEFIRNVNPEDLEHNPKAAVKNMVGSIINDWSNKLHADLEANPFTEEEIAQLSEHAKHKYLDEHRVESAYGTTLIAVAATKDYWFGIHIGDGKCVAVNPEGEFKQPIPWDDKCFLNSTTSICDSDALERARVFFSKKLPVAVFIGSDGVDDSFGDDKRLHRFYRTILYSITKYGFDKALEELTGYLPRLSQKASGDDISVSAILDLDNIGEIESVKQFSVEKEKARIKEKARLEALELEEERKRIEAEYEKREAEKRKKEAERKTKNLTKGPEHEAEKLRREAMREANKPGMETEGSETDTAEKSPEPETDEISEAAESALNSVSEKAKTVLNRIASIFNKPKADSSDFNSDEAEIKDAAPADNEGEGTPDSKKPSTESSADNDDRSSGEGE